VTSELEVIGGELCDVFADERRAIAALDHARLETLAQRKHELCTRLASQLHPLERTPLVLALVERIRIEASATALLAATAAHAVRAILGYDSGGYDRRAKPTTAGTTRVLASL